MKLKTRKQLLIAAIITNYIIILGLALSSFPIDFSQVPSSVVITEIGRWIGLAAIVLIFWQYLLGFRGIVGRLIPDIIWINKIHRIIGTYGFLLILLHPMLIVIGYQLPLEAWLGFETEFDLYVKLGSWALTMMGAIWLTSALLRRRLSYRTWKRIHLFNYLILPLVLIHSSGIGSDIIVPGPLQVIWTLGLVIYFLLLIYRIGYQYGFTRNKYQLVGKTQVANNVFKYDFSHTSGSKLNPKPGQFAYLQVKPFGEAHPFTISHFDEQTGIVSITAKTSGKFSTNLTQLPDGATVMLDGPFGVFTSELTLNEEVVFIAGGIGITPFLRNISLFSQKRPAYLFYGNRSLADIAFNEELVQNPAVNVTNALSNESLDGYISGRVDISMIRANVGDLSNYIYYICGPKPMMDSLETDLISAGVNKSNIYTERFSL